MSTKTIALLAAAALTLTACHRDLSGSTYSSSATGGKVLQGTVISARHVTVKDHDKLQDNTAGGLIGGIGGGVAGASTGKGYGQTGAAVGGAVIGAVAGALIQDALSTTDGMEYLVKLDAKHANKSSTIRKTSKIIHGKQESVEDDLKASIETDTQTDVISVIQGADAPIAEGSRVYVVYNDDRPRVVAMNPK